jgi:hypothetical protein
MQDNIQQQILGAFLIVLRPIARILLRFGIGFREFSEIAKTAFVDVASSDYGLRGRPTNISRVAVMTGLTRKEVRRLRNKIDIGEPTVNVKSTPLSEVLHRWYSEDEFLDSRGHPAILPFDGERASFARLVKRFGGDIPPGAMRTELKRVGAIEVASSGKLKLVKRSVRPEGIHDRLIVALVHGVYPLVSNVAHNSNPDVDAEVWPQISAFTQSVRKTDVDRLRRISLDRLMNVVESFDDLFMAYEALHDNEAVDEDRKDTQNRLVAVGVYYYEETDPEMASNW